MALDGTKTDTPPYSSYATFVNFIKGLRTTGVPSRIDKSVLSKMSGSGQSALIAGLKWLNLIDSVGQPTEQLEALVNADESSYGVRLSSVLEDSYSFMADNSIDLAKATGSQVEQKFRDYGISGSTVIKCVAFFIMAAKDAGIELGPHVRAPKAVSNGASKRRVKKTVADIDDNDGVDTESDGIPEDMPGFVKISIPLHGMSDGAVYLPDHMTKSQWAYALKITKFLIENYRPDDESEIVKDLA
jgi:Family of unknown function (DUF5343)